LLVRPLHRRVTPNSRVLELMFSHASVTERQRTAAVIFEVRACDKNIL
jgi:hypothetical protein